MVRGDGINHDGHEEHEEKPRTIASFVLFVSFVVKADLRRSIAAPRSDRKSRAVVFGADRGCQRSVGK